MEIQNTISKRGKKTGKKDRIELQQAFVAMLRLAQGSTLRRASMGRESIVVVQGR